MAPQKQITPEESSSSSSSAEEESQSLSASAEEGSKNESEKPEPKSIPKTHQNARVNQPMLQKKESEPEEEEADSEGEDEEMGSPNASDFTIKPTEKSTNPISKRPLEARKADAKESVTNKKAKISEKNDKKEKVSAVSASGGGGIPRVWSEENEIALLQGMIDYRNQKGSYPAADMTDFYAFVKGNLFPGVSNTQIYEKIRRLKGKFFRHQGKGEDGGDPVFSNPHEFKNFELSKKIWGGGIQSNVVLEQKPKAKIEDLEENGKIMNNPLDSKAKIRIEKERMKNDCQVVSFTVGLAQEAKKNVANDSPTDSRGDFLDKYSNLSGSFDVEMAFLKDNLHLVGDMKAKELEEEWIKIRMEEMVVASKKLNLMARQAKLVLDAVKKG